MAESNQFSRWVVRSVVNGRENNEDSVMGFEFMPAWCERSVILFALADGMGGHEHGELASQQALVKTANKCFDNFVLKRVLNRVDAPTPFDSNLVLGTLREALDLSNQFVAKMAANNNWGKCGSTLDIVLIDGNKIYGIYLGDSPVYIYHHAIQKLELVTKEHTVAGALVRSGVISPEMYYFHEGKSTLEFYVGMDKPIPSDDKIFFQCELQPQDKLLMCSDGVIGNLREFQIEEIFKTCHSDNEIADKIMETYVKNGETDNQTLILWSYIPSDSFNDIKMQTNSQQQIKNNVYSNEKEGQKKPLMDIFFKKNSDNKKNDSPKIEITTEKNGIEEALSTLNQLIGLKGVKQQVNQLLDGMKANPDSGIHYVFTGNPGTGKTTVARLMANIFKTMGVLPENKLVEVGRSGLVGAYVGHTAPKTHGVIDSAMGGVLFIDEAYDLIQGENDAFGMEAINALLKRLEDDHGKFICIVAGYKLEMKTFINANPGLQSRFTEYIDFEDYDDEELFEIFVSMVQKRYHMTDEAQHKAQTFLQRMHETKGDNFGNGRNVRQFFEKTESAYKSRLAKSNVEQMSNEKLMTIEGVDIETGIAAYSQLGLG